jgi:ATP-dependent DNA helicase RecG
MYSDRMEIRNRGGLFGGITVDELGEVHPNTRNAKLASTIELLEQTENRFTGIPLMRKEMEATNLPAPEFINRNSEFTVILKNDIDKRLNTQGNSGIEKLKNLSDTEMKIYEYCKTSKTKKEISDHVELTYNYTALELIKPLVERGVLRLTLPEKPRSKNQRYIQFGSLLNIQFNL